MDNVLVRLGVLVAALLAAAVILDKTTDILTQGVEVLEHVVAREMRLY